jgi:RNA polymerase sigma-70 factor (ECF subfamily)
MWAIDTFERFYESQFGPMVGLAYQLTGRRDVAEDLVQEAMVRAYEGWGRISSYERPDLWLRRAVLNLATSRWRRQRTAARSWIASGRPTDVPGPSAETDAVWEQVRGLPRRQAEVVVLYYGCDLPVDDVAAILECSAGTVRTHLVRARAALAVCLDPQGGAR